MDGTEVCSENFIEMLSKADMTIKDAENMLKLLEMAKLEMNLNMISGEESDWQGVDSSRQEALARELEDRHFFQVMFLARHYVISIHRRLKLS